MRLVTRPGSAARPQADVRALAAACAVALIMVPFAVLLLLVQERWGPLSRLDAQTLQTLHRYAVHHDGFVGAMRVLSFAGSAAVYVPLFAAIVIWLLLTGRRRLALFVVLAVGASSLLNTLVKLVIDRHRPMISHPVATGLGSSFPSGHAQASIVTCGVLLLIVGLTASRAARKTAVLIAAAVVAAIGFSRVALGVHYASDVLAGYILGAAWLAACIAIMWPLDRAAVASGL